MTLALLLTLPAISQAATQERPDNSLRAHLTKAISESDSFEDRFAAEVWLLDMSNRLKSRVPDDAERLNLLKNIHYEANKAGLHPELVLAVINVESNFNRWAISSAGARGLMQIMPFWLKEIPEAGDNLFDMRTNLRFGCTILKHYLDREKGDFTRALARYNGSLGKTWYPNRVFAALRKRWYRVR
ncbi:MAG TPA: lytic transglycosylase domain-containing protein [Chromatiales bacterium]|nr:lytic transglycosylase domain-containing protein [Chromatiales bacterium]HEX22047.1 lytic transglycosylase domain-containing protein [Chromatiales bacterium]